MLARLRVAKRIGCAKRLMTTGIRFAMEPVGHFGRWNCRPATNIEQCEAIMALQAACFPSPQERSKLSELAVAFPPQLPEYRNFKFLLTEPVPGSTDGAVAEGGAAIEGRPMEDRAVEERAIGFVVYVLNPGQHMHIMSVGTDPGSRQLGASRWLVEWALDHARGAECKIADLLVRRTNEPAIRLYESLGYQNTGRYRQNYYLWPTEDAAEFEIRL